MNTTKIKDISKENCCKCPCHQNSALHMVPCCNLTGEIYIVDGNVNEELLEKIKKKYEFSK